MNIRMWSTGELRRIATYHEGEPCLEITRPLDSHARGFRVMLNAAYRYREPKPGEEGEVFKACLNGCRALRLGDPPTTKDLARLAMYVADGIEDMLKLPPLEVKEKVMGEGAVLVNGERHSFDITESDARILQGEE